MADISHLPVQEQFNLYVNYAVRAYKRIEQICKGFGTITQLPELKPSNVYEITAYTVQIVSIYQSQGLDPAVQFINDHLLNSEEEYALLWKRFFYMARKLEGQNESQIEVTDLILTTLPLIMSMAVWCLLGNYNLDGTNACPTVRFTKLFTYLVEDYRNFDDYNGEISKLWSHWDQKTGLAPWKHSLEESLAFARGHISERPQADHKNLESGSSIQLLGRKSLGTVPQICTTVCSIHSYADLIESFRMFACSSAMAGFSLR